MLSKCFCLLPFVTSTPYFPCTPSPIVQPRVQIQDRLHCSMHAGDRGRNVLDKSMDFPQWNYNIFDISHPSYVYWTVHHLDGWINGDQRDVTCFFISLFNAQHVLDVNTSILRSLRLICWVISWVVLLWFDVCWCYVVVWLGWCGIRIPQYQSIFSAVSRFP